MSLRNGETKIRGIMPSTPLCRGPHTSTDRGEDYPCCMFCYEVRYSYYRAKSNITDAKIAVEFVKKLKFPDEKLGRNFCTMTTCGDSPVVLYNAKRTELAMESYFKFLKMVFELRRDMKLVDLDISLDNLTTCEMGIPILIPGSNTEQREVIGGDEGVERKEDFISLVDKKKAFQSGKWMHVINFHETLDLFTKRDKPERIEEEGKIWLRVF